MIETVVSQSNAILACVLSFVAGMLFSFIIWVGIKLKRIGKDLDDISKRR